MNKEQLPQVYYFDTRHSLSDPEINAPDGFIRASAYVALQEEMDARCDRAYCDGADAVLCLGPSGDDEASAKARRDAVAEWRAGGYGGRRKAARDALATSK